LVGMILSSHGGQFGSDFLSENGEDIEPAKDVDFNAGLSVAMTADDIMDFLTNNERLKAARAETIAESRKASGFRAP
jgi:hypothetical protein